MKYRKEALTTAGTLVCAIGIGFFMQQGGSTPSPEYQSVALTNADASVLDVEEIILTSAELADGLIAPKAEEVETISTSQAIIAPKADALPVVLAAARADVFQAQGAENRSAPDGQAVTACEVTAIARPVAAAMVNLILSAPCLPKERATVHHAGLVFSQSTDDAGAFDIIVPAMATDATFVVAFTSGEGAVVQTTVDELGDFDRVALQWKGDTGFELHARESGADYGSEGHVWSGAMRDMTYAVTGQGGYLSRLGDPDVPDGSLADVYTFPVEIVQKGGDVLLSVEAEVGSNNCGLEIEAQTLQAFSGKDITSRNLTLSVPGCDAAGNFLVLNNLFEDLKVASIN